jgi:riboflavin transporter
MEQIKTINKIDSMFLVKAFALAGLIIVAPLLKNQMITGTIVNCILFVSVVLLGRNTALSLCVIPSIISLFTGLISIVMVPIIPFIIISNMILVLSFDFLKKNQYLAVVLSALFKFVFLFLASSFVVRMFPIGQKAAVMFGYPQFFTALAGGVLAILFIRNNRKNVV